MAIETSPPGIGVGQPKRLRRPSMLSLAQTASFESDSSKEEGEVTARPPNSAGVQDPSSSKALTVNPFAPTPIQPMPRFGASSFLAPSIIRRTSSAPLLPLDGLTTTTPPIPQAELTEEGDGSGSRSPMDLEIEDTDTGKSPLRWVPHHLQRQPTSSRRKGKARLDNAGADFTPTSPRSGIHDGADMHRPPFTGKPLPAPLLATLISEATPLEHEMRSEARLQRLITSHPHALPFTPRAPRSSRGRFPETVDDDDDDDDFPGRRRATWARRSWTGRASSSDSDSDEMPVEEAAPEPVNSAFAAGMDMDRPASSSGSSVWQNEESGKSTPGQRGVSTGSSGLGAGQGMGLGQEQGQGGAQVGGQGQSTPASNNAHWAERMKAGRMSLSAGTGLVPSPGTGFGLPTAFGGLGMGTGTPLGSPTVEKLEVSWITQRCVLPVMLTWTQLAASPGAMSVASPGLMQYRDSNGSAMRLGKRKGTHSSTGPEAANRRRGS
jgi:hypothetical protein